MAEVQQHCPDPLECFTFFVDGKQFRVEEPVLTGLEIMRIAGIPVEVGLLLCLRDGTQRQVTPDERVRLADCQHFRRAPRFKRG